MSKVTNKYSSISHPWPLTSSHAITFTGDWIGLYMQIPMASQHLKGFLGPYNLMTTLAFKFLSP
jgi:hypothetical protein